MTDQNVADAPDLQSSRFNANSLSVKMAFGVAIAMTVVVLVTTVEAKYLSSDSGVAIGTDFAVFHGAAVLTLEGDGAGAYDRGVLRAKIAETTGFEGADAGYGHPPFLGLALTPFAMFPFPVAYVLFLCAGTAALGFAITRVGGVRARYAVPLALISVPGFFTLQLGQMGLWVSALLLAVYLAMRRGHLFVAGLLFGLLIFKPLYAVGIGLWWLLSWRRYAKAIAGAACSAAALIAMGFLVPGGWSALLSVQLLDGVAPSGFSVFEMWRSLVPNPAVAIVAWALSAVGIVVFSLRAMAEHEDRLGVVFALATILGLLITLRTGWYDWVLLVVPGVLLWAEVPEGRNGLVNAGAVLFPVAALSWPLARSLQELSGVYLQIAPIVLVAVSWWWLKDHRGASDLTRDRTASEVPALTGR